MILGLKGLISDLRDLISNLRGLIFSLNGLGGDKKINKQMNKSLDKA